MKYIEVDKEYLIHYLKNFYKKQKDNGSELYKLLMNFLADASVKDLINDCDIKNLYKKFDDSEAGTFFAVSVVNELLISSDIDILEYIEDIPENCFFSFCQEANIQITLPKHIKSIGRDAFYDMGIPHIKYEGTRDEFTKIANKSKDKWYSGISKVICSDGVLKIDETYGGVVI